MARPMMCSTCWWRISASCAQAKRLGWELWVGGAKCPPCQGDAPRDSHLNRAFAVASEIVDEVHTSDTALFDTLKERIAVRLAKIVRGGIP